MEKPKSSYQIAFFNEAGERVMRVHVNADVDENGMPTSPVYFEGFSHWYDGSATDSPDMPSGYGNGDYKEYMRHIAEHGEAPEVTARRQACYKMPDLYSAE